MATAEPVLKPDFSSRRKHFIFTEEHDRLRESIGSFVEKELAPHSEEWEETTFPDWVFRRMGELGFLGLVYPEEYGGQGGDYYCNIVLAEEMTKSNSGGLAMGIAVHTDMATPPDHLFGTEEQKRRYLVPSIRGELISCLGITEPDAGSDVSGIKTRAVRHGAPGIPGCPRAGGGAARPGGQGLLPHHVGAPGRAPDRGGGLRGGRAEVLRQDAPVRDRAHGLWPPDRPLPGDPPQVRRHGDED